MSTEEVKKEENGIINKFLDTKHPLLTRFKELCPGTFKHSQALASMIDGVAISLELDSDLLKLAATYHDIGKMFNPKYFTENQLEDEDAHKNLDPKISYEIITRHVSDSVAILINEEGFPAKAIEIISQHHGQTVLRYFFNKASCDVEDFFRYKTTKPTCIESAILMICDAVEATSRSRVQSGSFDPVGIIEDTINGLIDDSQLDEVTMRLGDLKKVKLALGKELEGTYQKRVDYGIQNEEPPTAIVHTATVSG